MKHHRSYSIRLVSLVFVIVMAIMGMQPQVAQAALILSVAPVWHPGSQLTTLIGPSGDTYPRYVDAEVYVTTNAHFWSAQLTCTIAPTILGSYNFDSGLVTPDPGDDVPMVNWGPAWGSYGNDYTTVPVSTLSPTGVLTATAARLGTLNSPLGSNGYTQSILLATFRYQVKSLAGTSPFTCTSVFLDRNGVSIGTATYTAPAPLTVIAGYTLSGSLAYQGRTIKNGIGVNCVGPTSTVKMVTDATGKFSATTRALGHYECTVFGGITQVNTTSSTPHDDIYMEAPANIDLTTKSYNFLPFTLPGGNVDRTTTVDTVSKIDNEDIVKITTNYNLTTPLGDVNGDGKTSQADLTIASGNFNMEDNGSADHLIFGLARSWLATNTGGPDNRIWVTTDYLSSVTQIGTSTSRDFWPMLSPDGRKIAFTREVPANGWHNDLLFVMNADGTGVTQISKPPTWGEFSFAPSWSPDSSRLAFDCTSWQQSYNDWSFNFNRTNICVVDATGKNLQQVTYDWNVLYANIYPPAWLNNTQLLYGGRCGSSDMTICLLDIPTTVSSEFSSNIDTSGGRTNDYPVVVNNTLFYRTTLGSSSSLRMADLIAGTPITIGTLGTTAAPAHVDVTSDGSSLFSTDVDYYTVSTNGLRRIAYYDAGDHSCSGGSYTYLYYNPQLNNTPGDPPTWTNFGGSTNRWIQDQWCSPYWDGIPSHGTPLWAERNTVDWEP